MPAQQPTLSPKIIKDLTAFFFEGFNDDDASFYFNLPLNLVQAIRVGSVFKDVRRGVINRKKYYINKIINGKKPNTGIIWFLERRFPKEFAKPETQLNFAAGPTTHNTLVVSAELAEAFLARSKPIDDELSKLLKERDQRSLLNGVSHASKELTTNDASHSTADTPDAGVSVPGEHELTCKELVKDELVDVQASPSLARYVNKSARARERSAGSLDGLPAEALSERSAQALDGHLPGELKEGHPPPVPPAATASPPLPPSGENPKISDLSSNKLNISEVVVKRKPGRPKKKV